MEFTAILQSLRTGSFRRSRAFIETTVSLAVFTDIFLYALIVPVMPFALTSRTKIRKENAIYGGALAVASPICGWLADRTYDRKTPLLLGLVALAGATVLLQVGPTISILILGRVFQGISAAVVWIVGLALLVDTVPQAELGQAMGWVFLAMSLGVLVGPLLGGVLFEKVGYDAVYAVAYGFILLDIILRLLLIAPTSRLKEHVNSMDNMDSLETMESGSTHKISDSQSIVTFNAIDLKVSTRDIPHEATTCQDDPASKPRTIWRFSSRPKTNEKQGTMVILISSPRMLAALWGVIAMATLASQFDAVLPIHMHRTFGWTSLASGIAFLPMTITALFSPLVGWGVDKVGPRPFVIAGFVSLSVLEGLLCLVNRNSLDRKILLYVLLSFIGISFDLVITPLLVEVTAVVDAKQEKDPGVFGPRGAMAQAYGLFNFAWAMGSLVGPIWAGFINEKYGWRTMALSLTVLSVVSIIPTTLWTGGLITKRTESKGPISDESAI